MYGKKPSVSFDFSKALEQAKTNQRSVVLTLIILLKTHKKLYILIVFLYNKFEESFNSLINSILWGYVILFYNQKI